MFGTEVSKRFRNITGFTTTICLQEKASLYSFYRWKKYKSLLFRQHINTKCPFWHAQSLLPILYAYQFSFKNLLLHIFEAQHILSPLSRVNTSVILNLKAHRVRPAVSYWPPHPVAPEWDSSCPAYHFMCYLHCFPHWPAAWSNPFQSTAQQGQSPHYYHST